MNTLNIDPDIFKTIVVITIIVMIMRFIMLILKKLLDHKLKNKIIDKGVSEELASSILQPESNEEKYTHIKWFLILLATGIGLFITDVFLPLGIHSIGIMAISISIGFLAFSQYLKRFDK